MVKRRTEIGGLRLEKKNALMITMIDGLREMERIAGKFQERSLAPLGTVLGNGEQDWLRSQEWSSGG
jgi:hypothetical protein